MDNGSVQSYRGGGNPGTSKLRLATKAVFEFAKMLFVGTFQFAEMLGSGLL